MVIKYELGDDYTCETYEYEVDLDDLEQAVCRIIAEKFDLTEDKAKEIISELDLDVKELAEKFEDEIHDFFEDAAMEQYNDERDYAEDPYSYYGVRRSDF